MGAVKGCPRTEWREAWQAAQEQSRDDLDGLHQIWPDYWPSASSVHGGEPCGCAWCVANQAEG